MLWKHLLFLLFVQDYVYATINKYLFCGCIQRQNLSDGKVPLKKLHSDYFVGNLINKCFLLFVIANNWVLAECRTINKWKLTIEICFFCIFYCYHPVPSEKLQK